MTMTTTMMMIVVVALIPTMTMTSERPTSRDRVPQGLLTVRRLPRVQRTAAAEPRMGSTDRVVVVVVGKAVAVATAAGEKTTCWNSIWPGVGEEEGEEGEPGER